MNAMKNAAINNWTYWWTSSIDCHNSGWRQISRL